MKRLIFTVTIASFLLASLPCASGADVSLQGRLGYDSNPIGTTGSSARLLGNRESHIYGGALNFAATSGGTKASYSVETVHFSNWASENFTTHRFAVTSSKSVDAWVFNFDGSSLFIDGSRDTLASIGTINANAISIWRERREQWQHRLKLQGQYNGLGKWVVRDSLSALIYDYGTRAVAGRVAFADRSDFVEALDVGWKENAQTLLFVGARAGRQWQEQVPLPNCAFDYSNTYARFVVGVEKRPSKTSTFAFSAGPDFRHYDGTIDPHIFLGGRDRTSLWFEGNFSTQISPRLTWSGKTVRMAWLSSTGKSAYIDTCAESTLSWVATSTATVRALARTHRCDYFPTVRDDWESFGGLGVTIRVSKKVTLAADVVRHRGWNSLDAFPEREFGRTLITVVATTILN